MINYSYVDSRTILYHSVWSYNHEGAKKCDNMIDNERRTTNTLDINAII